MAAQKLTKGRLIQIIILMIILITAFIWRTVTYQAKPIVKIETKICNLNLGNCLFNINNKQVTVTLSPPRPQANTPIRLQINNIDAHPSAIVSGITMNKRIAPIIFTQNKNAWQGEFTVPQYTHDNMIWGIDIKINDKTYSSEFTVTK